MARVEGWRLYEGLLSIQHVGWQIGGWIVAQGQYSIAIWSPYSSLEQVKGGCQEMILMKSRCLFYIYIYFNAKLLDS